jgi:hypothetical protein
VERSQRVRARNARRVPLAAAVGIVALLGACSSAEAPRTSGAAQELSLEDTTSAEAGPAADPCPSGSGSGSSNGSSGSSSGSSSGDDAGGDAGDDAARWYAANRDFYLVSSQVQQEDAPRGGVAKTTTTESQVATEQAAANQAMSGPIGPYETAVAAFKAAYLASKMDSTDAPQQAGAWAADDGRDELGSRTVDAKLAGWLDVNGEAILKFAVVDGNFRVGPLTTAHVDIAGGPAHAAGLIKIYCDLKIYALENTSGGYRPGWFRNETAVAAIPAGYAGNGLEVFNNPTGNYDRSVLLPQP